MAARVRFLARSRPRRLIVAGATALAALSLQGLAAADTGPVPTPIGAGSRFHPGASNAAVLHGLPIGALACSRREAARWGAHVELFVRGRVVIVPAGIGIAPPVRTRGVYIVSGRCSYPARTREPTGVIELARATRMTLADFFSVWGQPLTARRLLGFRAPPRETVRAYVNGARWRGDIRSIPLRRHDEIVLELGGYIPPHASYRFPKGL